MLQRLGSRDADVAVTDEFVSSLNLHASKGRQKWPNKKTFTGSLSDGNIKMGGRMWASTECPSERGAFE